MVSFQHRFIKSALMKKAAKIILYFIILPIILVILLFFIYFNLPVKTPDKDFELGVTFSDRYAESIGLDYQVVLRTILSDLKVRKVRLPVYWDQIEKEKDQYDFSRLDWQLDELASYRAKAILVVGQKVPRWPECHIPEWVGDDKAVRYQELLEFIGIVVERYRGNNTVLYWQVENEPFLPFGICPPADKTLLDLEIATVRSLDGNREIIITDSGELSLWIPAAKRADFFGTTLYRSVVTEKYGGISMDYPIGPNFFKFKKWLIEKFAKQDKIMIVELQAEPWLDGWTTDKTVEEQLGSMNAEKLRENVEFAKKTGFSPIYLWGVEWWYWLKDSKENPDLWEEAKKIFEEHKIN